MKLLTNPAFKKLCVAGCLLVIAGMASVSQAQIVTLADGNSTASVDVNGDQGMYNWTVDGMNQLKQQWFWFRVGNGAQATINSINPAVYSTPSVNQLMTTYGNAAYSVTISYTLNGGGAGSGSADIIESIAIHNNQASGNLDFHFFQYSDFNLLNTPGGDTVTVDPTSAFQQKGGSQLAEGIISPDANYFEANTTGGTTSTLYKLMNNPGLTLSDTPTASGDVTWAFQWDESIAAGATVDIFKDKQLFVQNVPEPATVALLGLGLVAWGLRRRAKA